jgi:hypothetical protein
MAGADRLSSHPDKVPHRILSFTPAKETASTSVLSRRWRGLWLQAGVLNLDNTRPPHGLEQGPLLRLPPRREGRPRVGRKFWFQVRQASAAGDAMKEVKKSHQA